MGSESDRAHRAWFRTIADHYDALYGPQRVAKVYPYLHDLFRRHGPVTDVLDVACGTFALDLPLVRRGYRVVGRDFSPDMLRVARRNAATAGLTVDVAVGDMRTLRLGRTFDAVLCLGTAFNYLQSRREADQALTTFRRHLRPGGLLVLDLTNFDAWIRNPRNACTEVDHRASDGTRIAIYAFNEQNVQSTIHFAGMLTLVQRGNRLDIGFDEAPLRIWTKEDLATALRTDGFRPVAWHGDLRLGSRYERRRSPRLVAVAART